MAVNTKRVTGRRKLRYESLDDFLADAEKCASDQTQQLGNWSPGQVFEHLTITLNKSIDGFGGSFPLPVRLVLNLFMKNKFLNKEVPSGFKAPRAIQPKQISNEEGLAMLQQAIERQKQESHRALHPGFGKLSREDWEKFHLRHAEMHMSFLVPNEN